MRREEILNIDIWTPEILALLIISGIVIGIINTLAGSGTAISYAVFMMLGLPPSFANGSVRIGVITQTLAASINFFRSGKLNIKKALKIAIPISIGSAVGAQIAVSINQEIFRYIVGAAVIVMLFFVFYKPTRWLEGKSGIVEPIKMLSWHYFLYFAIGVYGGFIQMGVGIFLLSALVLISGYNLLYANSLKVFIVLIYTPFALIIFIINDDIHYAMALISAIGNTIGGLLASKYAMKYGVKFLRWVLITVLILFASYLFGAFNFLL